MNPSPNLPKLHYSTWGLGFYSEHWLTRLNCWMFGMVKLAEANFDWQRDAAHIEAFEKLCGSDHMFIYEDKAQQTLAKRVFIQQYNALAASMPFAQREVISVYPIDPFQAIFVYATLDKPRDEVIFEVSKLDGEQGDVQKQVKLQSSYSEQASVHVFYQYFMLQPDANYRFSVQGTEHEQVFASPEYGLPFYFGENFSLKPKYDIAQLQQKLGTIWGEREQLPVYQGEKRCSQPIHTRQQLDHVLANRQVAIFKYNKEGYALIQNQRVSPYRITCVFDDTHALADAGELLGNTNTQVPVYNRVEKIADTPFDAIVLTCALNYEKEVRFFRALVAEAIKRGIPVISLYDDVLEYDVVPQGYDASQFFIVGVPGECIAKRHGLPEGEAAPHVLAVMGTDSVQGKFTTQLALREALKSRLKVAHWSTEPTGILLGAELGYSRIYGDASQDEEREYVRCKLRALAQEYDVIITGGQNSMIFEPPGKNKENNASTHIFKRFLPNKVVLTVSVDTPIQNVQDSIAYLAELAEEQGIQCQVVALAMLSGRKLRGSRWTETYFLQVDTALLDAKQKRLETALHLPVFAVPDEINPLADHVAKSLV